MTRKGWGSGVGYDAATMAAVVRELEAFRGGRVERIYQTARLEVVLLLSSRGARGRLLLSASPDHARAHLTAIMPQRPPAPPPFCMLLRRHLEGRRLLEVEQETGERVLGLRFAARDDLGRPAANLLVTEVMGRHSNIILVGTEGRILDAIKRVGATQSRHRQILPGLPYLPPPAARGRPPAELEPSHLLEAVRADLTLWQVLLGAVRGAGPTLARQVLLHCGLDPEQPAPELDRARAAAVVAALHRLDRDLRAGNFRPNLLEGPDGQPLEYWVFPLAGPGIRRRFATTGELLDHVYGHLARREAAQQAREVVATAIRRRLSRLDDLAGEMGRELEAARSEEGLRRWGELLTANLYRLPEKLSEVTLPDHLDPEHPLVTVPLDLRLTPAENARRYFERYSRARRTVRALSRRLAEVQEERAYLGSRLQALEAGAEPAALARELRERGYRVETPSPGVRSRPPRRPFARYRTSDGLLVLAGRNDRENEELLILHSSPADLWLHAQKIPGSHVILKTAGQPIPPASLREAAQIAAYHSRARRSGQVPVDYVERRHVRKPSGLPPGKVIYQGHRTLYVTPSEEVVGALRERADDPS